MPTRIVSKTVIMLYTVTVPMTHAEGFFAKAKIRTNLLRQGTQRSSKFQNTGRRANFFSSAFHLRDVGDVAMRTIKMTIFAALDER